MGTDLVSRLGGIHNALTNAYEQLVIDAYLWDFIGLQPLGLCGY